MAVKIYGHHGSSCTKRVAVTLREYNVPYEIILVDLPKGAHKSAEHLKIQPFGQIPVLDDDGFMVYESRAISQYIAAKYAAQGPQLPLLPATTDTQKYAQYAQAASIEQCHFDPYASKIVREKLFVPMFGGTTNEEAVKEALETLNAKLDVYEKILSTQKYMAGDNYTLADLYHLPYAHLLGVAKVDWLAGRPNVTRWWNDISTRSAWEAVKNGA